MTGEVQQGYTVISVVLDVDSVLYALVERIVVSRFERFLLIMEHLQPHFNLFIPYGIAIHYDLEFREETLPVPHATNEALFAEFT